MAHLMMVNHGMTLDGFFEQDLELFLMAQEAAQQEDLVYIDEIS